MSKSRKWAIGLTIFWVIMIAFLIFFWVVDPKILGPLFTMTLMAFGPLMTIITILFWLGADPDQPFSPALLIFGEMKLKEKK